MMRPKSPKLLEHIANSTAYVAEDTEGATLATYIADRRLRQVVERNLEIIAEALRLERVDPETADRIANRRKIIGMRNRIAHEYDDIDHQIIWDSTQVFLPELRVQARELLEEAEREFVEDFPDDS